MGETKNRSIRVDDEVWQAIQSLPGKTNEALRNLLINGDSVPVERSEDVLGEILELVQSLPDVHDLETAVRRVIADNSVSVEAQKSATNAFDPRSIPGVSVGLPRSPASSGAFPCRCIHSGCRGLKFNGTSRFDNMCDGCRDAGHSGDPRNCSECLTDLGAL